MPSTRNPIIEEDLARIASANLPWEALAGKTVLVTGASGFVPAYLVETLLYLNETQPGGKIAVVGMVRNPDTAAARFAAYRSRGDLQLVAQDVSLPPQVERTVDFIIHAASQASPKYYGVDPVGTLRPNVLGTYQMLEKARRDGATLLFLSSAEVYGDMAAEQIPTAENCIGRLDPLAVRSCYAESKRMGESMCVSWHHQYGVPAIIARLFHTYGPRMSPGDGRVFADFVADVVAGRDIRLTSDGTARRAFCYLADATIGLLTALLRGQPGEAYNIGNPQAEVSIRELAETLVGLFPEKGLRVICNRPPAAETGYLASAISRTCPDISKIGALGWEPAYSIANGFRRTVESFQ